MSSMTTVPGAKKVGDLCPREMRIKINTNKGDLTKIKSFCIAREIKQREHAEWEKTLANEATETGLTSPKHTNSSI